MKRRKFLLIITFFICFCDCSYGQHNEYYYRKGSPAYKLYFYKNGTFFEFVTNRVDHICSLGENISKGRYTRNTLYYILDSDKNWLLPDTLCLDDVKSLTTESDSLRIVVDSPYERMLKQEQVNRLCPYPHHRIYLYSIRLQCGNDSINQSFEKQFNTQHVADSIGLWGMPCPPNIEIHSIVVTVYWNEATSLHVTKNSSCRVFVYAPDDTKQHSFVLKLPDQADYFLLTKKYYQNQKVRRINSRTIMFNGKKYKKMSDRFREKKIRWKDISGK